MKKVLTFGVFDYFHYGHLKLFKQAKQLGDFLIIDEEIKKRKPNHVLRYSFDQRAEIISELRVVDQVVPSVDVEVDIKKIDFDILALGEEQNNSGFQYAIKWCMDNGKDVIRLKRTPGISSTLIKEEK